MGKHNISVVWHEGLAGRKQEEITSTFVKTLEHERDVKHVTFWLDNCAAQNKNWCLYSTLICIVNGKSVSCLDITLKYMYFERGHTFMSADSVHHGVEKEMSKQPGGNVFDFPDFVNVVVNSNSVHMNVLQLAPEDLRAWVGGQSTAKLKKDRPMLADLVQVQVRRGSSLLYYKQNHDEAEFKSLDFLRKNFSLEKPPALRDGCRGITEDRKAAIIAKLCPMMPQNRRRFWNDISIGVNDNAEDVM